MVGTRRRVCFDAERGSKCACAQGWHVVELGGKQLGRVWGNTLRALRWLGTNGAGVHV